MDNDFPPDIELRRLEALRSLDILDTTPEASFDEVTRLAAQICATPISLVSLIDARRQWFKSHHGLETTETPREYAFCTEAIKQPARIFEVTDAAADPRYATNPLVTGEPHIRFYAGAALTTRDGVALGTLNVIDRVPRQLAAHQRTALRVLAHQVSAQLELRRHAGKLEGALDVSEERFRALAQMAPIGLGAADGAGQVWYVNEQALSIIGRSVEDCVGSGWVQALHPDDRSRVAAAWGEAVSGKVAFRDEFRFLHPDGRVVRVIAEARPIEEAGRQVGYVATLNDITPLEQMEQMRVAREVAEQASRAKSMFVSHVSHELRTPLNAILGFSQVLQIDQSDPLSALQAERVEHIRAAGSHLLDLINEMLDLAAIESGRLSLAMAAVPLGGVAGACVAAVAPIAAAAGVALQNEIPEKTSVAALCDSTRLRQILLNLLSNAIKYNLAGGTVRLSATETAGKVSVVVDDTGTGMTDAQLSALFQPFDRLGAERGSTQGTGLGLVISRQLARLMEGELTVRSVPGAGSAFTLELRSAGTP